jgi:hypothetical protein
MKGTGTLLEQHYTPTELSKLWGFSTDTIRNWFEDVAGVLKEDRPERMHKRRYRSIRIPHSVALEVYGSHLS